MRKPSSVQIGITDRCNLKCVHCDIWKREKRKEVDADGWRRILSQLKCWLGPYRVDISGGEPFIRGDLIEIIKFCSENEIKPVVTTNATLLDETTVEALSKIEGLSLNISLDGANPKTHDYLRGAIGTYQKVINILNDFRLKDRKCHITLATILMGYNIIEVIGIVKKALVDGLADWLSFQALDSNFASAYDPDWREKSSLWIPDSSKKYFISVVEELMVLKERGIPISNSLAQLEYFKAYFSDWRQAGHPVCNVGSDNFIINPSGEVLLCWNMSPVGDMTVENPDEVWGSPLAENRRAEIRMCHRTCRVLNCNFGP